MLMTGKPFIQEVLFFPQMKPEVKAPRDKDELFIEKGVPSDIIKKYKLEVEKPSQDLIAKWVE